MKKITVVVEAITPVFAHVEPEGTALWRAAPFRGMARWWYRCILGAGVDEGALKKREAAVFGTAQEPSAVILRVFPRGQAAIVDEDINPGSKRSARRRALAAGSVAELELRVAPWASEERIHEAWAALWAALHLGGIGQRARRGGGSLRILEADVPRDAPKPLVLEEPGGYARSLAEGLHAARTAVGMRSERETPAPAFPILHSRHATVGVGLLKPGPNPRLAIMSQRRALHRTSPNDKGEYHGEMEFGDVRPRLSSPLWVRVAGTLDQRPLAVVSLFTYRLPTREQADWARGRQYLTSLDNHTEVSLR